MSNQTIGLPKIALYLGYGGVLPFLGLTILGLFDASSQLQLGIDIQQWLAIYAAIILSFIGAVYWGVVIAKVDQLSTSEANRLLVYSNVPALLAWFSFLLPLKLTLLCLGVLIFLSYFIDRYLLFNQLLTNLASEFSRLRLHLSSVVAVLLIISGLT